MREGDAEYFGAVAAFVFGLILFGIACMAINSWDYHESRQNRIRCAEYNADIINNRFSEGPNVTIDLDACHPYVP